SAAKKVMAAVVLCGALVAGLAFGAFPAGDERQAPTPPAAQPPTKVLPRLLDPEAGPLPAKAVARIGSPRLRHSGEVSALAYSPDGKWLASLSTAPADATARLWDTATGREQLRVKVTLSGSLRDYPAHVPRALGFSADARQFLVVDLTSIRGFDVASGKERFAHRFGDQPPAPQGRQPL